MAADGGLDEVDRRATQPLHAMQTLHQLPRGAYRSNADAFLLADFAAARSCRRAVDLGAGVGAVGLALLDRGAAARVILVEIDAAAAALAQRNLDENGWTARGEVIVRDVRHLAAGDAGAPDLVVCNPPYVAPGRGRAPSDPGRARARQGDLASFVDAARRVLGRRGRAAFVYPANEATTLLATLRAAGLEPKRLRAVHARAKSRARVVLVEAQPAKPGGLDVLPPLVEIA